jgi:flagellum-specific ATP synthase
MLTRRLAEAGHFPAIDIGASVSRVMSSVVPDEQMELARRLKRLCSLLEANRDMITIGAYRPGNDVELDRAVTLRPRIEEFLRQDMGTASSLAAGLKALAEIVGD